ncbi:peptidylprolyl isomerase [Flavobacterium macrobrachii]|uniref:Periplasmic chaperone PpiD n=1 Tax=Flavobacterium macrobrachii TaxID=591204 RepID=A0ABS2CZ91_9FLAO|nr:peptidylprolyl isomerase [Flavobacterium macrobrachii]MBM6500268.1 peptidylprolyl isomerase [Flavobacterium macrobrachii]
MAVLSKIRNRSGLLIAIIAFALFAFVIGDLFQSGSFGQPSRYVGSVNGEDVAFEEFRIKVANAEKSGQGVTSVQAANQVWNQEISIALLTKEFEKLGLRVGEKHIVEVFKADPNIGQNPMFLNAVGKFDIIKFKEYFKANPEGIQFLKEREKDAELNAKYQIYNSLVKGGLYTTNAEGKLKYEADTDKVTFDFVNVPYSSVKDSDIKITDEEINAYVKTKEKRFKSEETREIEYVLIDEKPSTSDEAEIKGKVDALLLPSVRYNKETGKNDTIQGFRTATNIAEFVNANSDIPFDSTYIAKQDLPAEHADKLFALATGEIYGPYMFNNYYCISKGLGRKAGAKSKASHILISWEGTQVPNKKEKRTKEQAQAKATELLAQAQANPGNFFMLAMTNSDDSSAQQGGDLGYFAPGQMVKPFNDFVFNNPIGKIGLVETEFGYHIINVTDKQDAIKMATIAQKIAPSEQTNNKTYEQATKFEMEAATKDFTALAKQMKLTVAPSAKLKPMDESFGTIQNQRQIVKWAFADDTNTNDVKRFEIPNVGHVIAKLKKVTPKGLMSAEEARPMVENILKNKKKAEKIKAKLNGTSLTSLASANKVTVMNALDLTLGNPALPGAGFEPKVVGTAFASKAGQISKPIEGNSGVYVVVTKTVTKAPAIKDFKEQVTQLSAQAKGNAGRIMSALRTEADIEDNRADFY